MANALDIPLVAEHDTWISVDPIVGCPANCAYCFLGPLNARASKPLVRSSVAGTMDALRSYLGTSRYDDTPVCLGNHTDMCMSARNRKFVLGFLAQFAASQINRSVCIVTKSVLTADFVKAVAETGVDVVFFLSQSYATETLPRFESGRVARPTETMRNAELISAQPRLHAVHFWRPFIAAFNPIGSFPQRVAKLAAASFTCSVVTPLMLNPEIRRDPRIATQNYSQDDYLTETEVIGFRPLSSLLATGRELSYPIYRNTSCALALIAGRPDPLDTSVSPVATSRCIPCSCPSRQRTLCAQSRRESTEHSISQTVTRELQSSQSNWQLKVDPRRQLEIHDEIDEYTHNSLTHQIRIPIVARSVRRRKAWLGAATWSTSGDEMIDQQHSALELFNGNDKVQAAIQRLHRITGFITTLTGPEDRRPASFSRYNHIRRVAWLASLLCAKLAADPVEVMRIVWLHDLNRWPFAHNSERDSFNQNDSLAAYYASLDLNLDEVELDHLRAFHEKDVSALSRGARVALLADLVTGMIEDPLLAVVGLNVNPHVIPQAIAKALALPLDSCEYIERLRAINIRFASERDPRWFNTEFEHLFRERAAEFLRNYPDEIQPESGMQVLFDLAFDVKQDFLREIVWPINNEEVCHGDWLRREFIKPLLKSKADFADHLLRIDEDTFVSELVSRHGISVHRALFYADLDTVTKSHSDIAFVKSIYDMSPELVGRP